MQQVPPTDMKPYFRTLDDIDGPIVWKELFGNDNQVEIDVGCGRGLFVVNASQECPDRNFLGIEVDFRAGRHGARRLEKRSQPNGRILGGNVNIVFEKFVPPHSVAAVHVYFPDPWWKRRHRPRRVFNELLLDQMSDVLVSEGHVHSWTDVEEYFHVITKLMDSDSRFEKLPTPVEREAVRDDDYHTSFERKKRKEGFEIFRAHWKLKK